jgi:hypothetical protein
MDISEDKSFCEKQHALAEDATAKDQATAAHATLRVPLCVMCVM